ncbi:MAG: efflux RND transporter periplasmic adaptor subunit [Burkholderiales bacterium]|nr:efflux RND transporter periplasmic adaptor subunit [Burkholderiales bacterium]
MQCLLSRRAPGRVAPALVLSALLVMTASSHAADEFAVTAAQMQGLGITVQRLDKPADIQGQAYPARVVLPPSQEQVVSAPLAGLVDRVLVGENDTVKSAQPLLRLISPELGELQLKLLEASSKSRLSQKTAQRERMLFADGIIPERRVQEAEGAAEEDRARVQQAEAALRLAGMDTASVRKIAAGGALQDGLTVHAKTAGTVMALDVKAGQRVAQADALMRLADTRQLWLDIQLPADRRSQVAIKGGKITVVGRDAAATPMSLGSMVSDSQTVTLRAQVTRGAPLLRPGEYVQVQVPFAPGSGAESWPVPVASVVRQGDKAYVFVRTSKGFLAQPVTVLNSAGASVQVQGPLKAGQDIAVTSVIALKAAWLGKSGSN